MTFNVNNSAELISFKDENGRELIHQADSTWKWSSPIIFPILGKAKDNKITCNKKSYSIPQHGIARLCSAETIINSDVHKFFEIRSSKFTKINYPYDFKLKVEYFLANNVLHISNTVVNTGKKIMYFNIGAHPGFNLEEGYSLKDYVLLFAETENNITFSRDISKLGVFKGNKILLSNTFLDDNALFMKGLKSKYVVLKNIKTGNSIKVTFETDTLGIWTRYDSNHPFICIEPWQTFANSNFEGELSKKPDITKLRPNEKYNFCYSIEILNNN